METEEKKEFIEESLEESYEFKLDLEDGSHEVIRIPRFSTRLKSRLLIKSMSSGGRITIEDIGEWLIDNMLPGLLDRKAGKSPTYASLSGLITKILIVDGESIFGKDLGKEVKKLKTPQEKVVKKGKKRGRKSKSQILSEQSGNSAA